MRYCEYEDCDRHGPIEEMMRAPTGEWYCLEHAALLFLGLSRNSDR